MNLRGPVSAGLAALAMAACASKPQPAPSRAAVEAPAAWMTEAASGGTNVAPDWWNSFGDRWLAAAVEEALASNTDLAAAEARVREAQATVSAAHAALAPAIDLTVGGQDQRRLTDLGRVTETLAAQPEIRIGYEVDLWGRVRDSDAAARAGLQANRRARDAAALSVASATARTYLALVSTDAQLDVARHTLETRREALALIQRRVAAGYASELDLAQARADHDNVAQRIPALELAAARQESALRLLTGALPGPVTRGRLQDLRLPEIAPGLPSSLLVRRPDIAQAESQLLAADASLSSAQATLLPQVRLTASTGQLFVEHLDPISVWTLGGSILAPLFDGGRRAAQIDAAAARRDQAAWAYRGVALRAFSETETSLVAVSRLSDQEAGLRGQNDAMQEAADRAARLYATGQVSHLEALDARRRSFDAGLALLQVQEARLGAAVSLYQALGGGWSP